MKHLPQAIFAAAALALPSASLFAQSEWTDGHGDIGVGYEAGELEPHWHLHTGAVVDGSSLGSDDEYEAGDLQLILPDNADTQSTRPASSAWDPIGVGANEEYWTLPSSSTPGIPYLGWATEELDPAKWSDITFTLTGLTGPGDVTVFSGSPNPNFHWASFGGISSADNFVLSPDTHTHYFMTFSQTGIYSLDIQMSGVHSDDGNKLATDTFSFHVVPEPSTGLLLGIGMAAFLLSRRRRGTC